MASMPTATDDGLHVRGMWSRRLFPHNLLRRRSRLRLAQEETGFVPPHQRHLFAGSERVPDSILTGAEALQRRDIGERTHILLAHGDFLTITGAHAVFVLCSQERGLHDDTRYGIPARLQ